VNFARDNKALARHPRRAQYRWQCHGDDGIVIDLSQMKPQASTPTHAGHHRRWSTLADLDAATQTHRARTAVGINSHWHAGLTLGGGFGWLSRKYGMTVDNLSPPRL